jgi:hypothetical protein
MLSFQTLMSDVQALNFSFLTLVRDAAREDLAIACCRFGLPVEQLKAISELSPAAVMQIVASMGDEALFAPRDDLGKLLTVPPAVLPVVSSARERVAGR